MSEELQAMSHAELLEQAAVLEVDGAADMTEEQLREAIAGKLGGHSSQPAGAKKKSAPRGRRKLPGNRPAEFVTVVVEESDNDRQPAYVGLNGRSYRIKRGVEVEVPRGVAQILLTSKQRVRNDDGTEREVPTYPTRVVSR